MVPTLIVSTSDVFQIFQKKNRENGSNSDCVLVFGIHYITVPVRQEKMETRRDFRENGGANVDRPKNNRQNFNPN